MRPRMGCLRKPQAAAQARSMRRPRFAPAKQRKQNPGTRPSRRTPLASSAIHSLGAWLALTVLALPGTALAQALQPQALQPQALQPQALQLYVVAGDAIPN